MTSSRIGLPQEAAPRLARNLRRFRCFLLSGSRIHGKKGPSEDRLHDPARCRWYAKSRLALCGRARAAWSGSYDFLGTEPISSGSFADPGLSVEPVSSETECFPAIQEGRFDALHLHSPGYAMRHPIYPLLKGMGKRRPYVVETNILGWLTDWAAHPVTDQHLFVSMTSACQAARRSWKSPAALRDCGVARNPIRSPRPLSAGDRTRLRSQLGLDEQDIVALRLGRPDAAKWTDWECLAVHAARQGGSRRIKLIAIEPPRELAERIAQGVYGDGILSLPLLNDPLEVDELIQASDIILHAARYGESFGYAIAEGMAAGKSVISRSTPWGDNAQVELVDHGQTGFICCSLEGFTAALEMTASDADLRARLGGEGRKRILDLAGLGQECTLLNAAFPGADSAGLRNRWEDTLAFAKTFPSREWNVFEATHGAASRLGGDLVRKAKTRSWMREQKARLSAARATFRAALGLTAYR